MAVPILPIHARARVIQMLPGATGQPRLVEGVFLRVEEGLIFDQEVRLLSPVRKWFLANFRDRRIFEDYQHLYEVVNIYRNVCKSELKSHRFLASTTRHTICSIKKDSETTQPLQGGGFIVVMRSKRSGFALALLSHAIEHTLFQQIDVGPAKHLALEHFETVDLPLHWPRAPRQGDARFHCIIIRP